MQTNSQVESGDDPLKDTLSKYSNTAAADEGQEIKGALRSGEVPTFGEEMFIELEQNIRASAGGETGLIGGFETPTAIRQYSQPVTSQSTPLRPSESQVPSKEKDEV